MNPEPRSTLAIESPRGPRDVELMPRGVVLAPGSGNAVCARIGLYGSPDGVTEIRVPFGGYFPAGDQLFRLEGWEPNPDQPDGAYAGGPMALKLIISWFGDAPRGTAPPYVWEVAATHRALPVSPPCGFTVATATARGEFGTRGMAVIRVDGAEPYELGVPYEGDFMVRGVRWRVDGWTVSDPATGEDGALVRVRRCEEVGQVVGG